jgi:cell division septum initiation protein DivIVA
LDELDRLHRAHVLEIRQLRESYQTELEERTRMIESLEERLDSANPHPTGPGDKDAIIQANEHRIEQLTAQCQFELEARSQQLDKLSETLARLEKAILENDRLRNGRYLDEPRAAGLYESPFRPDQARRLHLPNPAFEVDTPSAATPKSRVQATDSPRFRETLTPRVRHRRDAQSPSSDSPPRFDGRKRAPPHHRALVDSLAVREDDELDLNLEGMTVANMRKSLASLEEERAELGRRINRPLQPVRNVETFQKKVEREIDEREYDLICRMIVRIKAALQARGRGKLAS